MPVPIYTEAGRRRGADNCRPLVLAVAAKRLQLAAMARGQYPGCRLPPKVLPGVRSVGFWDADHPQDWGLDWHGNEGIELTFLESGSLGFAVAQEQFQLRAGDLTFTRPWQQHCVGNPHVGAGRLHFLILDVGVRRPHQNWRWPPWIVLAGDDLRQLTDILRHNEQPVWRATVEVARCFGRIGAAVEEDREGSSISMLAVQINQLLLSVLGMFRRQKISLDPSLSSSRRTVELFWADLCENQEHLALEWTVRAMARRCGMGVTSFISQTKQLFNMTPIQYLNHCRLVAASKLLAGQPDQGVTQIALACGFASGQYFATLFRRHMGVTPKAFRAGLPSR